MTIEYKDSKRIQGIRGEEYYEETDVNSGASMSNGGIYYAYGTEIRAGNSAIGKQANKWTIQFGRNNSPQGVVEAHIYTGTEGATSKTHSQTSTNSVTVDNISTSDADYSFTFATPHTISAGDVIALVWKTDTSTSSSNYVNVRLFNALTDMPNTRNYMVSTANWDGSDDDGHTWSVAPSPYTTYTLTSKLELTDDKPLDVQDNSLFVEKDTARRYWFDVGAESNVELTTGVPFTTHSAGWDASAWMSELADLPHVGDVVTGGKIYVGTSAGNVRLGLYSDNGSGVPQTLLAETASTAVGSAGAWQEIDFITPYTTTSTGKLHLGLQTDTSGSGFGYTVTIANARSEVVTSYGAFPNTITSQTTDSYPADLRAVVERPAAPTWTMEPTYEDDFSSYADQAAADAVWISNDTADFRVNITNDNFAFDSKVTSTTNTGAYYDLGTALSDTAWVVDFKMVISTLTLYSSGSVGAATYITMNNSGTGGAIGGTVDAIGFYMSSSSSGGKFEMTKADGGALNIGGGTFTTINATGTYYVRIIRLSPTSMRLELYSDPERKQLIEGKTRTDVASTTTGLQYFRVQDNQSSAGTGTGQQIGTIDDIKIYNGVTTPN